MAVVSENPDSESDFEGSMHEPAPPKPRHRDALWVAVYTLIFLAGLYGVTQSDKLIAAIRGTF